MTTEAEAQIAVLLEARGAGKTICPSEAAKALAGPQGEWRAHMDEVHSAVDAMLADGRVSLSWKQKQLGERSGPYRIAQRSPEPD